MKLSIACRGGTTAWLLGGSGTLPAGEGYAVSYAVRWGAPTTLAATAGPSGTADDAESDLALWRQRHQQMYDITPDGHARQNVALEGRFSLAGLKATRERIAVSCRWPRKPDATRK